MITRYLLIIAMVAGYTAGVFFAGIRYQDSRAEHAEIRQLQKDAKTAINLEERDHAKEVQVVERIKVIQADPDTCLSKPLPDSVIGGLHDAGIGPRS